MKLFFTSILSVIFIFNIFLIAILLLLFIVVVVLWKLSFEVVIRTFSASSIDCLECDKTIQKNSVCATF